MNKEKLVARIFLGLLLVTPLVFLVNLAKNPFLIQGVLLNCGISLVMLVLLMLSFKDGARLPASPLDLFWSGWLALAFLSLAATAWHNPQGIKAVFFMGMDNLLFLVLNCVLVFYLAYYLARSEFFKTAFTNVLFTVTFLTCVYGLLQYFGVEPFFPKPIDYFQGRVTATFGNPAFLASFLVLVIPVILVRWLAATGMKLKAILGFLLLLAVTTLVATSARSAWMGIIVSIAVLMIYLLQLGYKKQTGMILKILAVVLVLAAGTVLLSSKKELLVERGTASFNPMGMGNSLNQRFLMWSCAGEMFIKHPLLGQGWGLFELFYPSYQGSYLQNPAVAPLRTHANHAHNEILHVAAELGVVGLLLAFYFLKILFKRTNLVLRMETSPTDKLLAVAIFAGLLGMLTDSMFNVSLHIVSPALFFWTGVGLVMGLGLTGEGTQPVSFSSWAGKMTWLVTFAVFIMIIGYNVLKITASLGHFQAMRYLAGSLQADLPEAQRKALLATEVAKLERAFAIFPFNIDIAYDLANAYYRQERLLEAESTYQEALEINFGYEEIYVNYGITELVLGHLPAASAAFEKALALNPNSTTAKDNLAQLKTP